MQPKKEPKKPILNPLKRSEIWAKTTLQRRSGPAIWLPRPASGNLEGLNIGRRSRRKRLPVAHPQGWIFVCCTQKYLGFHRKMMKKCQKWFWSLFQKWANPIPNSSPTRFFQALFSPVMLDTYMTYIFTPQDAFHIHVLKWGALKKNTKLRVPLELTNQNLNISHNHMKHHLHSPSTDLSLPYGQDTRSRWCHEAPKWN